MPVCSIIIPALNEAQTIENTLARLAPYRQAGCEIIVVDGGSIDATREIARSHADLCFQSARGRAVQMNAGAERATAPMLWFLHADTCPPDKALQIVDRLGQAGDGWGFFALRLSGDAIWCRVLEIFINKRSQLSATGTGDQGLFCHRSLFSRVGGFAALALMEDIELCARLKREVSPQVLQQWPLVTSSRRWESRGVVATVLLMWRIRCAFWLGVNHRTLARRYR
ncbi:MAG: TIGR04283 family arsenosugar biosynthesis glycosyltransferase [Pseudomonadales bacterium]